MLKKLLFLICLSVAGTAKAQDIFLAGVKPGKAIAIANNGSVILKNNCLFVRWHTGKKAVAIDAFVAGLKRVDLKGAPMFEMDLKDGVVINSADFELSSALKVINIKGNNEKVKLVQREDGKEISAAFLNVKYGIRVKWSAILKDNSNYIRQVFTFSSVADSLRITKLKLVKLPEKTGVTTSGIVDGSPIISKDFFFALESPISKYEVKNGWADSYIESQEPARELISSTVWGVAPEGQLRRGFLYYLERERAVPYRQMLHYNSWYDLSWNDRKLNDTGCLDRIQTFADSLTIKRHIALNSFLFDDGWDDNQTLWQINKTNFPVGFNNIKTLAKKYNASLGVWMSPWGGYEQPKEQRLQYGRKQNPPFETNSHGFSLSGAVYSKRFKDAAANFVNKYGVSMFKFDGVGAGDKLTGATADYQTDMESLLKMVSSLREVKPDLYFSLTMGTWPSPFWLQYGDALWRNGWDTNTTGEGNNRQQWLNYRDGEVYDNIVQRAPLYPLSSLMYHGICIADNGAPAKFEMNDKDISDEIWSFFGSGTSLQELYINPHKLKAANWNCLAAAIKWARENADIMPDTHWVGGAPSKGDVYGFASWSPKKAILTLRNPSNTAKKFVIDMRKVFELPPNSKAGYTFYNAKSETKQLTNPLFTGDVYTVTLEPFEVLVFNAKPAL
ncbi:enterotoxin [Mucilaginibacter rubeus]|uniref:Enterotoxin n=1 Tax=Mucilaginibacter rubeus TaxID=2027860 RepID=A0A5C1HYS1_9SPHI|nr:enterotoxin [Mucilaginibacter rubeus]QEM10703.1 enterotoxin [Mucilaginibacter rubeus]